MECAAPPPPLGLWSFIRHSLFREYGWQFFLRIALPHPLKTLRAIRTAVALDVSGDQVNTPAAGPEAPFGGPRAVLGLGFCMKPLDPPCPSGRFNHDCACLEGRFGSGDCRDYPTWLRADGGDKDDRTAISTPGHERLRSLLLAAPPAPVRATFFEKRGDILVPQAASAASDGEVQ